jgi:hypothetical protein
VAIRELLVAVHRGMPSADTQRPALRYSVRVTRGPTVLMLSRIGGGPRLSADDTADLVFLLEKDLTVFLQRRRPDLLFLHSAALAWQDRAVLLVGESGGGKSTTAFALLHEGFRYLSDELAPIDLRAMSVVPYPHALCLKAVPESYALPPEALDLGATIHVPPCALPGGTVHEPRPLSAIFILAPVGGPALRPMRPAEAAARLYTHVLNALAHPNQGLDAVLDVADRVPCFALARGELRAMCTVIREALLESGLSHCSADHASSARPKIGKQR